jgi:hypothetical protein
MLSRSPASHDCRNGWTSLQAGAVLAFASGLAWQAGLFAAVVSALSLSP